MEILDLGHGLLQVFSDLEKYSKAYVIVGFPNGTKTKTETKDGRKKKGGESMAEIAFENEFGKGKTPARSFMRTSFDENLSRLQSILDKEYDKVLEGKRTVEFSLNAIGLYVKDLIQKKITDIHEPPNSPVTIKLKKSSKPLIDFGQMRASVQHKVILKPS
jgi:hypothetical protein